MGRFVGSAVVVTAIALCAPPSAAQGLEGGVSGVVVPNPQSGGVDDVWALDVNPAGIAFVDQFQLVGGYLGSFGGPNLQTHRVLAQSVLQPFDGFSIGGGTSYLHPLAGTPQLHGRMAMAARFERNFAIGIQGHSLTPLGSFSPRFLADLGMQVRPWSWLGIGASLESLGTVNPADRSKARLGVSLRPLGRWVTVGADARVVAGSHNLLSTPAYTQAVLEPSLTARVQVYGLVLYAGGSVTDLGLQTSVTNLPGFRVGMGVEVNTAYLGATLLGGASGNATRFPTVETGALMRLSAEAYDSVIPRFNEWLTFTLTGKGVPEHDPENIIEEVFTRPTHPVRVIAGLDRAARDPAVKGVVLRLKGLSVGWGRAAELRRAITGLRGAGKKVVVHLIGGDDATIFAASAANKIYLSPAGGIALDGVHAQLTYLGAALERFGIQAEAVTAGEYKSAPRTFTHSSPSPEELEVQNAILDTVFQVLVEGIAEGRGLTPEKVEEIIDLGGLNSEEAVEKGIVDGQCYWHEVPKLIENDIEGAGRPRARDDYLEDDSRLYRWADPPRIAVVPVVGDIAMSSSGGGIFGLLSDNTAGADKIVEALNAAKEDDDVKAVVLRIDSPGGDAIASDLIWHAVMELRNEKPVIASMGDIAASGGYYVAAGAKEIFAEPGTLTGSIGVFSMFFHGEQLARDVGVNTVEVGRGALPGPNLLRGPTPEEKARMEEHVDDIYERFLFAIKQGRGMDDAELRKVAGGRVWTGQEAFGHGLVDQLGGIDQALARARELAHIDEGEEYEISILTQGDELLPRIQTAVRAMAGVDEQQTQLQRTVRAVLGEDHGLALQAAEGRVMAANPVLVRFR